MNNDLTKRDLKHNWHPYTQMKDCENFPPIPIERAEGIKLYDYDGNFYYDTISSWWCNVHGHNHPYIKDAIKKQLDKLEHVLFAGFTHKSAIELSEKLVKITPENLTRVFYSDDGSTAVETALKMSFQYWHNTGKKNKKEFLALDQAYHGDTIGTMAVSGVDLYNARFKSLFYSSFKAPTPYCYRCAFDKKKGECALECLDAMEDILKKESENIAAVILEPILMGAAGMIIYPAEYLKGVGSLAKKYDVHLIVDEVAAGFGRTGKMCASEHASIEPDFMCISKGVTSGYLPIGVTMTTESVYEAFYAEYSDFKTFYHGHTYTANPLACAAAIASIDLFEKENTLQRAKEIGKKLASFIGEMSELEVVGDARTIGVVGALELVKNRETKEPFGPEERIGLEIYKKGLNNNLVLRPLGNVIYLFLPLSVKDNELDDIFMRTKDVFSFQFGKFPVK